MAAEAHKVQNMTIGKFIRSTFVILICMSYGATVSAQDAALLPNAKQTFLDNNGKPLSNGKVYFYVPNTSTLKTTWQDADQSVANTNPVILDAAGRAIIYGDGEYRQVVRDRNNNLIWDQVTTSTGTGGGGGGATGDGDLVGTIKPWAGLIAPNQYLFAYGQEITRSTYPELFTAITSSQAAFCSNGSPTLTGIADTSQIPIGAPVEASCLLPGATVISKTASTLVVSSNANITTSLTIVVLPWGGGNGTTTFNLPDLRGRTLAGRDNMGGTAASRLTTTYFANASAIGATGGDEESTLIVANLPSHNHSVFLNDPGHTHIQKGGTAPGGIFLSQGFTGLNDGPTNTSTNSNTTNITVRSQSGGGGTANQTANTGSNTAFSIVQPTITTNYIIKVTPDTNSAEATGVLSISGMTGVITCGSGMICTGNIIDTISSSGVINNGVAGQLTWYASSGSTLSGNDNLNISAGALTIGQTGSVLGNLILTGNTSGLVTITPQSIAGTPTHTLPTFSGTYVVSATSPLSLNSTTGLISCSTCITGSSAALTKVDDTNVTLTLGGSPTIALLAATSLTLGWTGTLAAARLNSNVVQAVTNDTNVTGSISTQNLTLGWTGQLALTRGGTNASLTASNGGVVYSNASALAILAGTATANLPLLSGSNTTPSWASISYPTVANSGGIPYFSSSSVISTTATLSANELIIGGGAGIAPSTISCSTTTTVLHGGTPPSCSQVVGADVATNTLGNNKLVQAAASTLKGNPTSSTVDVSDFTLSGLSQSLTPDTANDMLLIWDSAANTFKKINPDTIASAAVAGVSSIGGNTGAFTLSTGIINSVNDIRLDKATSSNYYAATSNKAVTTDIIYPSETTTSYGTTTTFDFDTFINTAVTLTGNITTQTLNNVRAGKAGMITFIQDGSGGHTSVWNSIFKFAGGTTPTLSTAANAIDILNYNCRSTTYCQASLNKDVK